MSDVTNADLDRSREMILEEVREGFKGVHHRQDITNGRVGKVETEQARIEERVHHIGREVFQRRASDRQVPLPAPPPPPTPDEARPITRRDVKIVGVTVALVVSVVKFVAWFWPAAAVLKP